jgi:hypothetical protein
MRSFFTQRSLDMTGFWVSVICGLHCVAVPILVSAAVLNITAGQHTSIEYSILGLSSVLGVGSLLPSFFRHHRRLWPIVILLAGFTLIALGHFLMDRFEIIFTVSGACSIACAHVVNFKLCHRSHQPS